ncbi:MAG: hypothetical protein ACKODS_09645 [Methylophilaceae bacterium]
MSERQKLMDEVSWAQKKITDLRDMLDDGVPSDERDQIVCQIDSLNDVIFYNQEYLSTLN